MMKKITPFLILLLAFSFGYGQEIASFSSLANSGCSGIVSNDANVIANGICRGSGISVNAGTTYNSRDWTTAATLDANDYLEWSITPNTGFSIDLTTMDLTYDRSGQGPTEVDIQVDTGSGFTSIFTDASVSAGSEDNNGIDLSSITGITTTITFRLFAFNATSAAGTFDIEENTATNKGIIINGSVNSLFCTSPTVTWTSGAWSPISGPTINTPVVIADNYDTNTDGSFNACTLTVNPGFNLNVADNRFVVVENDVTVNGELFIQTQGNFVQNNDAASFTDNSTNGVRVIKGKTFPRKFAYTYWSSPVVDETIEQVFSTVQADRRFSFNATNFVDVQQEVGNTGVFNPGSDDIDDNGDDWQIASGTMTPGVGYAAIASQFGIGGFPRSELFPFIGEFNNGVIQVPLVNNSGGTYNDWNFIGNPYPGAIDADDFLSVNSALVGALYFWDQATPESDTAGGSQGQNFSVDDYAIYNGTMGIGARGNTGSQPNGFVASCQGFFVEALAAGNVTFNNSMRAASNNNGQFFKNASSKNSSSSSSNNNKLWVDLTTDNGVFSQIGVGYVDGATNLNDGAFYDARRITSSGNAAILYSTIDNDNGKFAIQGKASSSLNSDEIIKIGFTTSIEVATMYTISVAQFEGDFLSNNTVYLRDNLTSTVHNLSDGDYTFTSEVGEFNTRFEIAFNATALSANDFELNTSDIKIVQLDGEVIQFTTEISNFKSISVFDLLGRALHKFDGDSNNETYNLSALKSSVYIASITLENGARISKKFIKK